jgi:hypothetical protein
MIQPKDGQPSHSSPSGMLTERVHAYTSFVGIPFGTGSPGFDPIALRWLVLATCALLALSIVLSLPIALISA